MRADRSLAIRAALGPGQWLTHFEIHQSLPYEYQATPTSWRSTAEVCRREAKEGRLARKKAGKSSRGWRWLYTIKGGPDGG